jgi:hypothetical protein
MGKKDWCRIPKPLFGVKYLQTLFLKDTHRANKSDMPMFVQIVMSSISIMKNGGVRWQERLEKTSLAQDWQKDFLKVPVNKNRNYWSVSVKSLD